MKTSANHAVKHQRDGTHGAPKDNTHDSLTPARISWDDFAES